MALLLERSAQAVVAMLAVLKTGAAYLAIDPAQPEARIGFVLDDAAPIAAITTAGLRSRLDGCDLVVIDVDDPAVDTQPGTALPAPAADDIAYLIYTSGTTGVPKGVAVTHHNLTHLAESLPTHLPAAQVWTQCHSYAFDFSVWEIWAALLGGGRLVVVPEEVARLTGRLPRLAGDRTGQRAHPNPVGGDRTLPAGVGVGGVAARRGGLPGRGGGSVGARPGGDQRLRPHRGHGVCVDERAAVSRGRCGADRCAGIDRGVVRARRVVAGGAGRVWSASCMWPVAGVGCGYWRRAGFDASRFVACPFGGAGGPDVSHRGSGVLGR